MFDLDDADYIDERRLDSVVECCRESRAVVAGSEWVAQWCRQYNSNVSVIWTGTPIDPTVLGTPSRQRGSIVAWAPSDLLGFPGETRLVGEVLAALQKRCDFECWLYGIRDPQAAEHLLRPMVGSALRLRLWPYMGYRRFLKSLGSVAVGLAPVDQDCAYSKGKSFGKVLAYLSTRVAIVASGVNEYPRFFRHGENGMLSTSPEEWTDCVHRLLATPRLREDVVQTAYADFTTQLSTRAAAVKLDAVLRSATDRRVPSVT